jgi:hypothetical protein
MKDSFNESIFNYLISLESNEKKCFLIWLTYNLCTRARASKEETLLKINEVILMVNKKLSLELDVVDDEYPNDSQFCEFLSRCIQDELLSDILNESIEDAAVYTKERMH